MFLVSRLSPAVLLCLALAIPAHAGSIQDDHRLGAEAVELAVPGEVVDVEPLVEGETEPVAKPRSRPKPRHGAGNARHGTKHAKPQPVTPSVTAPPEPKAHFPSLKGLSLWLGKGALLALVLGSLGAAGLYRWRLQRSARTIEDLRGLRQGDQAEVRRLRDEVAAQKRRADYAEDMRRQAAAAHQGLRESLEAAEAEVERLRNTRSWDPVRSQMEQIALNRIAADPDAELDMDEDELPDDPSEKERLAEEAKRLKDQLATLRKADRRKQSSLTLKKVLNGEERDIFWSARRWAQDNKLWLHPQVSMGEFLKAKDGSLKDKLFRTFNARRVDFLIIDSSWTPVLVIEHQGSGHRQGNWRLHDLVKGLVLRLAGLPLVETFEGEKDDDIIHPKLDAALAVARSRGALIELHQQDGKARTV